MAGTLNCDVLLPPATEGVGGGGGSEEEEGVEAEFSPPWSVVDDLSVLVADSSRSLDWSCWVTTWSVRRNQADPSSDEAAMVLRLSRNFDTRSYKQWNNGKDTVNYLYEVSLEENYWIIRVVLPLFLHTYFFLEYSIRFCFLFLFQIFSISNELYLKFSRDFSISNFLGP